MPKVNAAAKWFAGHPERVLISAGAQSLSPEYSRQLSDLRAQTVRKALISAGVPETKILTVSFGEDAPASTAGGVAFSIVTTGE
jgi:outer membrane protein OmpA-like peptidoglycan-associated protein